MNKLFRKQGAALLLALGLMTASIAGCGDSKEATQTTAASGETTETQAGSESAQTEAVTENTENPAINPEDIAITVDGVEVKAPELYYNYLAARIQMENAYLMYGMPIDWTAELQQGLTFSDYLKSVAENQVLQVVYWSNLAKDNGTTLSDEDYEMIEENLNAFKENVSEADREFFGFSDDMLRSILEHTSLAGKSMEAEIVKNMEGLTEEEKDSCVYRTVQHILLKYDAPAETDASGAAVTPSEEEAANYKDAQKAKAEEVLSRAQAGEDFKTLADEFNEDSGFEYSLNNQGFAPGGASQYVQEFTDGAFALKEGEVTIVETEYGYHVMKCVSENDEALAEEAQRQLALSKHNTPYQEWITANEPVFYEGWQKYSIANDKSDTAMSVTNALNAANEAMSQESESKAAESETAQTAAESETAQAQTQGETADTAADETEDTAAQSETAGETQAQ